MGDKLCNKTAYSHSAGQDENYHFSVFGSYQDKQHKNNRQKMKTLLFGIFWAQFLVHDQRIV